MTKYAVVNRSSLVSDADCYTMWSACREQMRFHVAPSWKRLSVDSVCVLRASVVPSGYFPIYILDRPDIAGTLGYHASDPNGEAYARVFAEPILKNGGAVLTGDLSVSAVLSHEVIELFIDRSCRLWVDRGDGSMVAYEACDPVENDCYTVNVGDVSVSVSNFVFDTWFDVNATVPGTRYDWLGRCSTPLTMSRGGYLVIKDRDGKASNVFATSACKALHCAVKPFSPAARSSRRGA